MSALREAGSKMSLQTQQNKDQTNAPSQRPTSCFLALLPGTCWSRRRRTSGPPARPGEGLPAQRPTKHRGSNRKGPFRRCRTLSSESGEQGSPGPRPRQLPPCPRPVLRPARVTPECQDSLRINSARLRANNRGAQRKYRVSSGVHETLGANVSCWP